jgi:hypothetical protein
VRILDQTCGKQGTMDDFWTFNDQSIDPEYDNSDKGDNIPPFDDNGAVNYPDWYKNASGGDCPWCKDGEMSEFDPQDDDDAVMWLCSGHIAEFMGMSIDGVKRMESELYADRQ